MRRAIALAAVGIAACADAAVSQFTIDLPGALGVEFGSAAQRVVRLELFMKGKDIDAILVTSIARNPALAGWDARDVVSTLEWKGAALSGAVTATIVPAGPGEPWPWRCVVDAAWKDGGIVGQAKSMMGNTSMTGTEFAVKPDKLAESRMDDGFVELFLPGSGKSVGLHAGIEFRGGKAVSAASFGPLIHPVWQTMDVSGVELKRGRLGGKLTWTPVKAGEEGVASAPEALNIRADLRDGYATVEQGGGTGVLLLSEIPKVSDRMDAELAFDAALVGGERWRRRVVVRFETSRRGAKATAFFNGRADPDWNAVIDRATFERKNGRVSGVISATIAAGSVQPGYYEIRFSGEVVGTWIAGTFESELAGAKVAGGQFTGWTTPADH